MDSNHSADRTRRELAYSFHGCSEREMVLFKSFVRLLDHLTHQHWVYRDTGAHLQVVREGAAPAVRPPDVAVLILADSVNGRPHHLGLPIHADELERELNLLGDLITVRTPGAVAEAPAINPQQLVQLSRWPTPDLLTSRDRIRLATLMTGRPLSLQDIHERSGVAVNSCREFVSALAQSGMLVREAAAVQAREVSTATAAAIQSGLLSRIRFKLGLGTAPRAAG